MPETDTLVEVIARRSACPPPGLGNVVISTIRKRSRVTLPLVEFVTLRRIVSVPNVELLPGLDDRSLALFGGAELALVLSRSKAPMPFVSRRIGEV
jgi:hypothetical protein